MTALADLAGVATLVAVTVIVCGAEIFDGAVYNPAEEIVPTAGLTDQVTVVLLVPLTWAVNVWLCDGSKEIEGGVSKTATGAFMVRLGGSFAGSEGPRIDRPGRCRRQGRHRIDWAFTVRLSNSELLPAELVAVTVNVDTATAVGVPLRTPVEEPRATPAGSVPLVTAQVIGVVPLAANFSE